MSSEGKVDLWANSARPLTEADSHVSELIFSLVNFYSSEKSRGRW